MRYSISALVTLAASTFTLALPAPQDDPFYYEQISLTFEGGPASYTLNFAADGQYYPTNNQLSVSLIQSNGFAAYVGCNFYGADGTWLAPGVESYDGSVISIGPPQPISGVACQPTPGGTNTCLPVYSQCEWNGPVGTFILDCCSGYCAATKCRPT